MRRINIHKLSRFDALDIVGQCAKAVEEGKYGTACRLSGLDETLVDNLTMEEVSQCLEVRVTEIARRAGLVL